jgi:hypothetical protein
VVENVKGAQPWVGRARWHFGSYYLWGDVPALMPVPHKARKVVGLDHGAFPPGGLAQGAIKNGGGSWFNVGSPGQKVTNQNPVHEGTKTVGHVNKRDGYGHTRHLTNQAESDGVKHAASGAVWFDTGPASHGSKSTARKAASAKIAKIPFTLAQHIARVYRSGPCSVPPGPSPQETL